MVGLIVVIKLFFKCLPLYLQKKVTVYLQIGLHPDDAADRLNIRHLRETSTFRKQINVVGS